VQIGIELLAQRFELPDAVVLQHLQQLALGQLNAVEQSLDAGIRLLAQLGVERRQRSLHVVGNRENVTGEGGVSVLAGVDHFARGAPAQVLHLRQGAQQLVPVFRQFAGELSRIRRLRLAGCRSALCGSCFGLRGSGWMRFRVRHQCFPVQPVGPDIRTDRQKIKRLQPPCRPRRFPRDGTTLFLMECRQGHRGCNKYPQNGGERARLS
jgi:hypothetical protein